MVLYAGMALPGGICFWSYCRGSLISWVSMAPQTTAALIRDLKNSRDAVRETLAGISEEDARKSPGTGRWSALECVEHLTIAEEAMLGRLKNGEALAEPIHLPEREARMAASVAGRAKPVQAPPAARHGALRIAGGRDRGFCNRARAQRRIRRSGAQSALASGHASLLRTDLRLRIGGRHGLTFASARLTDSRDSRTD